MEKIYVFDFDGTLTTKDTLIEFIRYAKGTMGLLSGLLLFSPLLVLMKLHVVDNGKTKQRLFSWYFKGMSLSDFDKLCADFARDSAPRIIRQSTWQKLAAAIDAGCRVFVISASIDNWVKPFFNSNNSQPSTLNSQLSTLNSQRILGTELEVSDGRLTGRFTTSNCYGAEKVRRLQEAMPELKTDRDKYFITAYGDSRGDKEMMEYADKRHYKDFK